MALRKKDDGFLTAVALVVGAVLAVAPFVLLYLSCRSGPKLTRHRDAYALTHEEARQLQQSNARTLALDAQHRSHLAKGLAMTKSGDFDRRSKAGRTAFDVNARRVELIAVCEELQALPASRLSAALGFSKLRSAARLAIFVFLACLAYAAAYMLRPEFGWPSAYFLASAASLGVFAILWLSLTAYYWLSYSQLRKDLKLQPA